MRGVNRVQAAILVVLALTVASVGAPATQPVATTEKAAVVPVTVPPRTSAPTYLDVWVSAFSPPQRGAVEAVVTLGAAGSGETEIGRFTVFPGEPFATKKDEPGRAYRFNVTAALARLPAGDGPLLVRVQLLPIDPAISPAGAEMKIDRAELRSGV